MTTIRKLLRKLHAEVKKTDAEFDKHAKKFNCKTDMSGCTERAEFQERLKTLREIIEMAGGRV